MVRRKKDSRLAAFLVGPVLILAGMTALWENEGRFDFALAAEEAKVVETADEATAVETFALSEQLDTQTPIACRYLEPIVGYYRITSKAEIYSWESYEDDDTTRWRQAWTSSVEDCSRNSGIRQTLDDGAFFPLEYRLGDLRISANDIHLADEVTSLPRNVLRLNQLGKGNRLRWLRGYFVKGSLNAPNLGDERLSYRGVPNAPIASYFGKLQGDIAVGKQFEISTSWISQYILNDGVLHYIVNGDRDQALATMKAYFARIKWYTRLGGTFAITLGFWLALGRVVSLLRPIPLLGQLAKWGANVVSVLLGVLLSIAVMLISAIAHNLIVVSCVAFLVLACFGWLVHRRKVVKNNAQKTIDQYARSQSAAAAAAANQQFSLSADIGDSEANGGEIELLGERLSNDPDGTSHVEGAFINLFQLAAMDGLDKREQRFLTNWGQKNGVTKERMQEIITEVRDSPHKAEAASRDEFILLVALALVDGAISSVEQRTLAAIAKRLGLSDCDMQEVITQVENGDVPPSAAAVA